MEDIKELDKIADIKEEDLNDEKIISSFSGEVLDAAKAYLLSLKAYKLLSYEETTKLFTKYKATHSKKIRNKLIEHNLRLVVSVVNSVGRPNNTMDFLDLIQEGNIGLMKAIDRYDVSLGYRFSTYATYWIKKVIGSSLDNYGSTIRIPVHLKSLFYKYLKYKDQYQKNNGGNPKEEQIKKELNINDSRYKALLHVENNVGNLSSLNSFVSDDSDSSELGDFVADTKKDAYNDSINMMDDLSLMYSLKESLSKRLYYILYYRVFIEEKQTLEEISQRLGITRERIRQLDKGALAKAKIIIKKPRKIRKNLTYKDVLPEPVEKYVILGYLKKHLEPYKYYIFYQKWFLHENFYSMFSYENANYANQIYDEISEEYRDLLNYGASAYAKAVQEALETKKLVNFLISTSLH